MPTIGGATPSQKKGRFDRSLVSLGSCKNEARNRRVARDARDLLASDQKMEPIARLPPRIRCGQLRSAIRSVFPSDLTPVQELSIRTAKKLEKFCEACTDSSLGVENWKEARYQPVDVNEGHLELFKKALAVNVESGWDRRRSVYIPNGHATKTWARAEWGTWREDPFSKDCKVIETIADGKPRVVTLYAAENSELLSPLHDALYSSLQRKGWLLVGSPTSEKVKGLNGNGDYVSVDYKSATDNIKLAYVRAAIQVLKQKARNLSAEEAAALDVVGNLRIEGDERVAESGQPMGSLMSFPILCLVNKTVVDLSLAELAERGEISMKEFREHRCLINGDDLLYRELRRSRGILAGILRHGSHVGLVVQEEKTMVSPDWAEINSTAFFRGERRKKTNVSVCQWSGKVDDPVKFLAESICRTRNFRAALLKWRGPIARAERKLTTPIGPRFTAALSLVRKEFLLTVPTPPKIPNFFPVVDRPANFDLTREEIQLVTTREVNEIRRGVLEYVHGWKDEANSEGKVERIFRLETIAGVRVSEFAKFDRKWRLKVTPLPNPGASFKKLTRKVKTPVAEDKVLKIYADYWEGKVRENLLKEDERTMGPVNPSSHCCEHCYGRPVPGSSVECLVGQIHAFKERLVCRPPVAGGGENPCQSVDGDFVAFS